MRDQDYSRQFAVISVQPAQLSAVPTRIDLPFVCRELILPVSFETQGGTLISNPAPDTDTIIVRINSPSAPGMVWSLDPQSVCKFVGVVERIYVSVGSGSAAAWTFIGMNQADFEFVGEEFGGINA